jgi:folate-binding protein YgfZ
MASRPFPASLKKAVYICDSCLSSVRSRCSTQLGASRAFYVASSRNSEATTQRISQPIAHDRESRAIRGTSYVLNKRYSTVQSYSTVSSTPQAVVSGIASLPHRRLISLSGPEAAKFLHGLITNSVESTRLSPFYSAFLDARGRVLWDIFVWVWPELVAKNGDWSCYIEVDAGEVETLKKHLKRHKLRSKITIKDVPTEGPDGIRVWAAWGGAHEQVQEWSEIAGLADPRAPGLYRYLANADRENIAEGVQPVDTKYYHVQRYLHGVPEGPDEIPRETALPMEANIDLNGGIDFKKGCYVGQELTIRTKHTGVVRKRILPVRLDSRDVGAINGDQNSIETPLFDSAFIPQPALGTDIKALDENGTIRKGRPVGKIMATIGNVGLATCRLENMTSMRVSAEGGTYKPGMEFGVDVDGHIVKVEPVLYDWFVQRKEALWDREARKKILSKEEQDSVELE